MSQVCDIELQILLIHLAFTQVQFAERGSRNNLISIYLSFFKSMKVRSFNLVNPRLLETILNVQRLTKGLPSSVYRVESPIDKGTLDIFVWSQKKGNVYIFKLKLRANVRSVPRSIFSLNDMVMSDTRLILLFLRVPLCFGHSPLCFGHVLLCFGHVTTQSKWRVTWKYFCIPFLNESRVQQRRN